MLATLAALHLVVLTQVAPPREVTPADAIQEEVVPEEGLRAPVEVTAPGAAPESAPAAPASGIWATPPAAAPAPASPGAPAAAEPPAAPAAAQPPAPAAYPAPTAPPSPYAPPSHAPPSPYAPPASPPPASVAQENPPLPSKPAPAVSAPQPPPAAPAASAQQAPPAAYPPAEPVPMPRPPGTAPVLPPPPAATRSEETQPPPTAPRGSVAPPPAEPPSAPRRLSLLSGEPLRGGSTALAWGGWSSLGLAYGQGITQKDDLGGFLDYDWAKSELVLALAYRRYVGKAGGWDMASRLSAGYYTNFGSTFIEDGNRSDRGIEVTPGLSVSRSGQAGVFSAVVEGPITVTWKYGAGLLFSPKLTLSFEAPVYHEVVVGFRAGAAYRAGAGEAPLKVGAPEFVFLVLAGYHLL